METHLFINPHTLEVTEERCAKCKDCKKIQPEDKFYRGVRSKLTARCKVCYDNYYMRKNDRHAMLPIERKVRSAVWRAHTRSRYRKSTGEPLTVKEALSKWTGRCANCSTALTFEWLPRRKNKNKAIIDRIETKNNKTYAGNMQWMCNLCNTEKGAFDLLDQKQHEIDELRAKLKRKSEGVSYASILIPY